MSVQLGRWNFDGRPVEPSYARQARQLLAGYSPDGVHEFATRELYILYFAFCTTKESRLELQPAVLPSAEVLTWDGRLDNRNELVRDLEDGLSVASTDLDIVASAYGRWREDCFARFIGDWALSIWNPSAKQVLLARDFLGCRSLYYSIQPGFLFWTTVLDAMPLFCATDLRLEQEYLAGFLSAFPAAHLTPFAGIFSVPPSSYVILRQGQTSTHQYWNFNSRYRICYREDAQYEEHFRTLFAQSVSRRLRAESPVLAELSGGMDSSSIVCMADDLIANGQCVESQVETLSYFDDSEPNWNERKYFAKIEERRGRVGCHIDVSALHPLTFEYDHHRFAPIPGCGFLQTEDEKQRQVCIESGRHRVVLSGIGGDEVLGGVPTPIPELAELLVTCRFTRLASQLLAWALSKRKPLLHLFLETLAAFLPPAWSRRRKRCPAWVLPDFARRYRAAFCGYQTRLTLSGPPPSFQENLLTLEGMRRQLCASAISANSLCELRYPYLDRDLLEFLYAIPREQIIRPHQRRSLMRRALAQIVPREILNRKRKAFVARGPMRSLSAVMPRLRQMTREMSSAAITIVDPQLFEAELEKVCDGQEVSTVAIARTLMLERWLRQLKEFEFANPHGYELTHRGLQRVAISLAEETRQ